MADRNRHRILRQVLELELGSPTRALELQEAAARPFRNQVLPALEALFDRMAGPDELLRIDRLELDLGTLQGPNWQEQFHTRLLQQLQQSLEQAARSPATDTQRELLPGGSAGIPFQQLLFFLTHGRLPWWGGQPDTGWTEALLERLDTGQWQALSALLRSDSRARRRLIHTMTDSLLAVVLQAMTGLTQASHVLGLLAPTDLSLELAQHWRLHFWMALLELAADGTPGPARGIYLMQQLLAQRDTLAPPGQNRDRHAWQRQLSRDGPTQAREFLPLPQPWQGWLEGAVQNRGKSQTMRPAPDHDMPGAERPPFITPLPEDEAAYLQGAGAVILHPFLEELFRSRALLQDRAFRDASAQYRAVSLLGYLTFGSDEVPEYDLLLPKLLCGLPWEEPLPSSRLLVEDRAACEELLRAVLTHWSALKSTSPDWLREQFFLRQGKLERLDANWRLTVEHRLQDVLLARLPWGVSLIRLPWMQGLLYVRWTD